LRENRYAVLVHNSEISQVSALQDEHTASNYQHVGIEKRLNPNCKGNKNKIQMFFMLTRFGCPRLEDSLEHTADRTI
jgi:hypothetical protein